MDPIDRKNCDIFTPGLLPRGKIMLDADLSFVLLFIQSFDNNYSQHILLHQR